MNHQRNIGNILILLLFSFLIEACSLSGSAPSSLPPPEEKVTLITQNLTSYDSTYAYLNLIGKLNVPGLTDMSVVAFHLKDDCSDSSIAQGIEKDFETTGITARVPSTVGSSIFVRTNTVESCMLLTNYSPYYLAPDNPQAFITHPLSPSRDSTQPLVFAEPSVYLTKIYFYKNNSCTQLVGSGSASELKISGITLNLSSNTTNKIYSISEEAFGKRSPCELAFEYKHTTQGPPVPTFLSVTPLSPSKDSLSPTIKGFVDVSVKTVKLFKDPNCGTMAVEGEASTFSSTGLIMNVDENTTNDIYVIGYDLNQNPSGCTFLTRYIHDSLPPNSPQFAGASPASPTRLTVFPKIIGMASNDTATIKFFNGLTCINQIGLGSRSVFEGVGIPVSVGFNATTSIYAASVDLAGNQSSCILLTNYRHNTIPPDPPIFDTTNPISPTNQSSDPLIYGSVAAAVNLVNFFSDEFCSVQIGSGTGVDFGNAGILIHATPNAITTVYATTQDTEGNVSACTSLTNYMHSTVPASTPAFASTNPVSPSRVSFKPWIVGTAANTVSSVHLYSDNVCSQALGSGSRATFVTLGISVNLIKNYQNTIYGKSVDIYGNESNCVLLTQYIHDDRVPFIPGFTATVPLSPTNVTASPLITGTVADDPLKVLPINRVSFYDNMLCLSQLGTGTPVDFTGLGIVANLSLNTINSVYAQTADAAGNVSACSLLTTYMHSVTPPGKPQFSSVTPNTPSYTSNTHLKGTLGSSSGFLAIVAIDVYKDSSCTQLIKSGLHSDFIGSGISLSLDQNTTTPLYAQSRDVVGNKSTCQLMVNFVHSDIAPGNLATQSNLEGSINLTWSPDMVASPMPIYQLKRSLSPGGPYTLIQNSMVGSSFNDMDVSANTTYYYRIFASNNTGRSQISAEVSGTSLPSSSSTPTGVVAIPGASRINLSWTGFNTNATYKVFRSLQHGGPYQALSGFLITTNYEDLAVTNGVAYYYVVTGVNSAGASYQSVEVSAIPLGVPAAPLNLKLALLSSSVDCGGAPGVHLSWASTNYNQGYGVFRGDQSNGETFLTDVAGTQYTDCNPNTNSNGNQNYYKVAAKWGTTYSSYSNEVIMANMSAVILKLDAGNSENLVYWSGDSNAVSYRLERSVGSIDSFTDYQLGIANTNYLDTSITNDQSYYYRLSVDYGSGVYGWPSAIVSGMPHSNPSSPFNLVVMANDQLPQLSWSAPTHYAGFNIYRASSIGGPYTYLARVATTYYTDFSPLHSMNYYYITAQWGTGQTAATNIVNFRGGLVTSVAANADASSIALTWSSLSGINSYSVLRATQSKGPYTEVYNGASVSYSDSSASANVGYFYVVIGKYLDGTQTQYSNEVSGMLTSSNIPSSLTVLSTTSGSVRLTWANIKNATTYKIYHSVNSAGPFTSFQSATTNTINYTGLLGQTRYYFVVSSIVSGAESTKSSFIEAYTYGVPGAPMLSPGNNLVNIQWSSVTGASSYTLERTQDGVNFTVLASGVPTITFSDTTALNNQLYFYRVRAVFSGGRETVSSLSLGVTPGITPLVPSHVEVLTNVTGTDVNIGWGSIIGATSYKVYLSTSSGGPWTPATTSFISTTNLTGLNSGVEYFVVVTAVRGSMESAYSTEVSFVPMTTPAAPTPTVQSTSSVLLSWAAVSGANEYDIFRSQNGVEFSKIASAVATNSYLDTSVISGIAYTYRYLPKKSNGSTLAISSISIAVETSVAPLVPQGLRGVITGSNSIQLDWVATSGNYFYNIYRSTNASGPFSLIQTVTVPTTTYTDGSLTPGTEYFYLIRSMNNVGVESSDSNKISLILITAPTGLQATSVGSTIQVSWNSVGGSAGYALSRAIQPGGPYGVIFNAASSINYTDTNIEHGMTYYYVVQSKTAASGLSEYSSEVSAVASVKMNLEVPVELTDAALASQASSSTTFERTRTTLNTQDYDGVVSYSFEIHARNFDTVSRSASLVDHSNQVVGAITIPASTFSVIRLRAAVTPTVGLSNYRILLEGSTSAQQIVIQSARMLIKQVGATKTKIYYPLLNDLVNPTSNDVSNPIFSTSNSSWTEMDKGSLFKKNSQNLSLVEGWNGWELETLVAATGNAEGSVALFNRNSAAVVGNTQGNIAGTGISLIRSPFSEGAAEFTSNTEGNIYDVRLRCDYECSTGQVSIYKAGLWVTLKSLYKVELYYRMTRAMNASGSTASSVSERVLVDHSLYSNPQFYFRAMGYSAMGDSANINLLDINSSDSAETPATLVSGSTLSFFETNKTVYQTLSPLTVTTGSRFIPEVELPTSGSFLLLDAGVVIRVTP